MRLSNHTLEIELGRHSKPITPVDKRLCKCGLYQIEDECHFILMCPFYVNERTTLFVNILKCDPCILNQSDISMVYKSIMSSDNVNIIFSLAKYLQKCFKKRKSISS